MHKIRVSTFGSSFLELRIWWGNQNVAWEINTHTHTHTRTHTRTRAHTHTRTHAHAHTHTRAHTHTHAAFLGYFLACIYEYLILVSFVIYFKRTYILILYFYCHSSFYDQGRSGILKYCYREAVQQTEQQQIACWRNSFFAFLYFFRSSSVPPYCICTLTFISLLWLPGDWVGNSE